MQRYRHDCHDENGLGMVADDAGSFVYYEDVKRAIDRLQPVPAPLPWLDQPDGAGWWKVRYKTDPCEWWVIKVTRSMNMRMIFEEVGDESIYDFDNTDGLLEPDELANLEYQRMSQPELPGEAGDNG